MIKLLRSFVCIFQTLSVTFVLLVGASAIVASEAGAENSQLATGSLSHENITNVASYEAESSSFGVSFEGGVVSPNMSPGSNQDGAESSQTLATLSEGAEVTIGGEAASEVELAGINRDPDAAHEKLEKIFDLEAIREEQEFVAVAGEVMQQAMKPIIEQIGNAYHNGEMGDVEHKLAHALIGCMTGGVVNGDCAAGAAGAVAGEIAAEIYFKNALQEEFEKDGYNISPDRLEQLRQQAISAGKIAAGVAGASVGGDAGIAMQAGQNAAENNSLGAILNRLLHYFAKQTAKEAAKKAAKELAKKKVNKQLDDLMQQSKKGDKTHGKSRIYNRDGGMDQANADFDSLKPTNVKKIPIGSGGIGRTGRLPDGRKVVVRPTSGTNRPNFESQPTLEIQNPDKTVIKFRY